MTQVLDEERVERAAEDVYAVSCRAIEPGLGMKMCKFKDLSARDLKLHMDYARAAISAYLGETSGWQPIDTAPKDRPIMYHNGNLTDAIIGYCRWSVFADDGMETWWDYERDNEAYPKFWMPVIPLPSPPHPST